MIQPKNQPDVRVRDIISTLQTLPQDMVVRVMLEHEFTGDSAYFKLQDIEMHDLDESVEDRPWSDKVVVIKVGNK